MLQDFPRLEQMRAINLSTRKAIFTERAKLATEFFKKQGFSEEHMVLKQAQALKYVLENIPVTIFEDDLIVGSTTKHRIGCLMFPEFLSMNIWPDLPTISKRKFDPVDITEEEIDLLSEEIFPFWQDYTTYEWARKKGNEPLSLQLQERMVFYILAKSQMITHIIPNYPCLVNRGLENLIKEARAKELSANDAEAKEFYQAVQIAMQAVITLAERYAAKCEELAKVSEKTRAQELLEIASALRACPKKPAQTFQEALQAVWLTQVALHQENFDAALSFGRLDQFLYPYYKKDIEEGRLSSQRALELIGSFFIKLSDHTPLLPDAGQEILGGTGTNQAVTIGGLKPDGTDGTNELSYLMLKMSELLRMREPNVGARLHKNSPPEFRKAVVTSIYNSGAAPALYSDEPIIEALMNKGISLEDARDYGIVGCVETISPGRTMSSTGSIMLNLAAVLELTLHGGIHPLSGLQIGPKTGDLLSFKSFDEFMSAFKVQLEYMISMAVDGNNRLAEAHKHLHPTPLLSSLIDGTFASGRDVTWGGAKYNSSGVYVIGLADVADSLAALKNMVFDNAQIPKEEMASAIADNFEGHEKTFALLTRRAPKYGTDDDVADKTVVDLVELISNVFDKHKNPRGGPFHVGYWSITMHAGLGSLIGALPNGKKKGSPLASGATPVSGIAVKGPTASLSSTAKLPAKHIANSIANNHKIPKSLLGEPGKLDIFQNLVDGYFKRGGMQVQFIIQDRQTLFDAQKNPDAYRDLLVRVSGYTAYFCDLNKKMQDEIIARTEDQL